MKRFSITKGLIVAGVAAVMAVAAFGGSIVSAQDTDRPVRDAAERDGARHHPHRPGAHLFHALVEASGLDPEVIREGAQAGQTLAETFEANGVDPAAVKAVVLANIEARLDEGVASGEMTQEEADAKLARASETIDTILNAEPDDYPRPGHRPLHHLLRLAAGAIGIEIDELLRGLDDGMTIAQVAEANGVEASVVVDAIMAPFIERVRAKVDAGELSEEEAALLIAERRERVEQFVTTWTKPGSGG